MNPAAALDALRESGTAERAGERVARRLADVHALFGADMAWVAAELGRATRQGVSPAIESASHLLDAGGKRVRPLAVLLASACFGPVPETARELAVVAELVHLATLLHDDVIDDGQERRGHPTSRRVWGNAVSVLAGDLLLTHALERTARTRVAAAFDELLATLRRLVDGEVVQLRGRAALDVREATYFEIVRDKTASLFVWSARAGAHAAGAPREMAACLGEFGEHLGVAFQLVDDLLDYAGDPRETGKSMCADLREGKLTLPLIRAVASGHAAHADLAAVREGDNAAADRIAAAVRASGACDDVRMLAREETRAALASLARVPEGAARDLLAAVAADLAARIR